MGADVRRFTEAAYRGDVVTLRKQVRAGQNLDAKTTDGWTALANAALGGEAGAVRFLLEEGADASVSLADPYDRLAALGIAKRELAERKKELAGKDRSWNEQSTKLDSQLNGLSECVKLLWKRERDTRRSRQCQCAWCS
jgi:ankyrin repeat protein